MVVVVADVRAPLPPPNYHRTTPPQSLRFTTTTRPFPPHYLPGLIPDFLVAPISPHVVPSPRLVGWLVPSSLAALWWTTQQDSRPSCPVSQTPYLTYSPPPRFPVPILLVPSSIGLGRDIDLLPTLVTQTGIYYLYLCISQEKLPQLVPFGLLDL